MYEVSLPNSEVNRTTATADCSRLALSFNIQGIGNYIPRMIEGSQILGSLRMKGKGPQDLPVPIFPLLLWHRCSHSVNLVTLLASLFRLYVLQPGIQCTQPYSILSTGYCI